VYKIACHIGSNTTYVRALAQYFIAKLKEVGKLDKFEDGGKIDLVLQIIFQNEKNNVLRGMFDKLVSAYMYLVENVSVQRLWETRMSNEIMEVSHGYIIEDLKRIGQEVAVDSRGQEGAPRRPLEIWTSE